MIFPFIFLFRMTFFPVKKVFFFPRVYRRRKNKEMVHLLILSRGNEENDKIRQISTANFLQVIKLPRKGGEEGGVVRRGRGQMRLRVFEAKHFVFGNGQISILLGISFPEATVCSFSTAILKYFKTDRSKI